MTRFSIISALCLSFILIGAASWTRIASKNEPSPSLLAVESSSAPISGRNSDDFFAATSSKVSNEPLNQTDLVGRQFFADYMQLSSKGQGTSENLNGLAEMYAEKITGLESYIPKIERADISEINDSKESIISYGNSIASIQSKYENLVIVEYQKGDISDIESPAFSNFMTAVSKLYKEATSEITRIKVPRSLSANHLDLINNYLETAEAARTISQVSSDPLSAYTALNMYAKNSEEEATLLFNIQLAMASTGGLYNNSGL